jgi:hypothetical protein
MKTSVVLPFSLLVVLASGALACGTLPTSGPTPTPAPTPTPLPVQAPRWEGVTVHTLCLEVDQSYPEIEGKSPEPIAEAAVRILAKVGLQVVAEGTSCDATLTLSLTGHALGDEYTTGYCYSGAEVGGLMRLDAPGREPLSLPVAGKRRPPFFIRGCPTELEAPFEKAWSEALLQCLAYLWGPQVLIQALQDDVAAVREAAAKALGDVGLEEGGVLALAQALEDENEDVRQAAAKALEAIGPEAVEAIPALIQALGDDSSTVRGDAAEALMAITGQDFGEDAERWRQWWEEHQLGPPAPPTSECTPDAVFEADVTVPDGTQIDAGQPFVKTWRVRNTGTCGWDTDYRLVFVDGEQMGGPDSVAVPDTQVGETAQISVELIAPQEQGRYQGYWRMCVGGTECFGDRVYVEIVSTE